MEGHRKRLTSIGMSSMVRSSADLAVKTTKITQSELDSPGVVKFGKSGEPQIKKRCKNYMSNILSEQLELEQKRRESELGSPKKPQLTTKKKTIPLFLNLKTNK